jgi:hypothetical protein
VHDPEELASENGIPAGMLEVLDFQIELCKVDEQ